MRNRRVLLVLVFASTLANPLSAQPTWRTAGLVGGALTLSPENCSTTWYDPEAFFFPDGTRGFLAQGIQPNSCTPFDALYSAKFDAASLTWQLPALGSCPTLGGRYADFGCGETPSLAPNQPLASPAIAKVGSRYYMAFSGGNADLRKGHVFWAYSDNGVTWNTLKWDPKPTGFNWKPLIYPLYGGVCDKFGVAQLTLTYDPSTEVGPQGAFYIHLQYLHRDNGAGDSYIFRFPFSSANGFGLGGPMQVCINGGARGSTCTWTTHSGAMVFDYDGQPPAAGDPLLSKYQGNSGNFNPGAGSIVWNPSQNNWLRVYGIADPHLRWQTSTSLSSGVWTAPGIVDMTRFYDQVRALYPQANLSGAAYGGLFWGTIGSRTGMWLFQPSDIHNCPVFTGVGIFTVALNYN